MPYIPDKIKAIARICAYLLVFILTVETCARIEDRVTYGAPFFGRYDADLLRSSENGIPCNVPNARYEKWSNNSLGFRGAEVSLGKPVGMTRVVCLGSSETYGLYESNGKEWPAQMQEILPGKEFQVINSSVVGLSISNYDGYVRKHVLPLKPDIVAMCINPLFYAVSQHRATRRIRPLIPHPTGKVSTFSLASQSRVLPKLRQTVKQAAATYFPDILKKYQVNILQSEIKDLEQTRLKGEKPKDSVPERFVEDFRTELESFIKLAESEGITLILITYPSLISSQNMSQLPEISLDIRRYCIEYSLTGMVDVFDRFNSVIRSSAEKHHISLVDMSAIVPKSTEYFGDCVHYTDRGARTIAEHVAQEILSTALNSPSTGSKNTEGCR